MKISVNSTDLKSATIEVKGGLSTAKLNPLYETIRLDVVGDTLSLMAQDDCIKVVSTVVGNVEEIGAFRCNGSMFCNVVAQLASEQEVELETVKDVLVLTQGKAKIKVKEISGFVVSQPEEWDDAVQLLINAQELSDGLSRCLVCVSKENSRPLLKGINIATVDGMVRLASLDGYKISRYFATQKDKTIGIEPVTIYSKCVQSIQSLCAKCEEISVFVKGNMVKFESDSGYVECSTINGKFFSIENFFSQVNAKSIAMFDAKELRQAISLACVSVETSNYKIDLDFDFENSNLVMQTQKEGAESKVEVPFEKAFGENTELSVNSSFLLDCIKSIKDEKISIVLEGATKPMLVGSVDSENSFGILPIRRV